MSIIIKKYIYFIIKIIYCKLNQVSKNIAENELNVKTRYRITL